MTFGGKLVGLFPGFLLILVLGDLLWLVAAPSPLAVLCLVFVLDTQLDLKR